jgi:uncharacterized protein (UPF0335 family)
MGRKKLVKEEGSGSLSEKEIREIIKEISDLENQKDSIAYDIKGLKEKLEEGGFTKKQINEAIRLMRMDDDERNEMLQGSNVLLKSAGRCGIVL